MQILKLFVLLFVFFLASTCSDDSLIEEDPLFEYTSRTSGTFYLADSGEVLLVENPIGFINISGGSDSTNVQYILDKTVKVKDKSLAQSAFDGIILSAYSKVDTTFCEIISPIEFAGLYRTNMNLIVPYTRRIVAKNQSGGITFSHLFSEIYAETNNHNCEINFHNGSMEAHSISGQINATINLPENGYCFCHTESGDITIQIPASSSVNVHLKSKSGTINYSNLDINIDSSSETELKGSISSGSAKLYIESTSGNILLNGI